MSMKNNRANCWLFCFIWKRCNQASINQWLKWTPALQLSLSGHLTSPLPPILSLCHREPSGLVLLIFRVCSSAPYGREHHMCPAWRGPWISLLWIYVTCFVCRCGGDDGGFHTDRINMWKWLTSLYVSDVIRVLQISWEAFSKDMINLQNMVDFPSVGYSWRSASFVHCLACPCIAYMVVCVRAHACKHMSACVSPLCNHLHDGLIGLAAKRPKASAA